ncbi:hypothetical protein DRJ48_02245 [Candidatus Woesearchaeota archaeon]|nr:hypothetical protein [Candidatus Woesearchaeota archaeon]RLE42964.1 MAG: hypothetical protein DRJ48_02245 [Candidatus Woesearchaeota archaeon]
MVKIGINGAGGRIGKRLLEFLSQLGLEVVMINDWEPAYEGLSEQSKVERLFEKIAGYDYVTRNKPRVNLRLDGPVIWLGNVALTTKFEREPEAIGWSERGVEIVEECSGAFRSYEKAMRHMYGTVRKVILSAPGDDKIKHACMGVNHNTLSPDDAIISNASCTSKDIAVPLNVLIEELSLKIKGVYFNTVHSATNTQRAPRSIDNILLHTTGASIALKRLLPNIGTVHGRAYRVPTADGSWCDVTVIAESEDYISELDVKRAFVRATANIEFTELYANLLKAKSGISEREVQEKLYVEFLSRLDELEEMYIKRLNVITDPQPGLEAILNSEARKFSANIVLPQVKVTSEFIEEMEGAGEPATGYYLTIINFVAGYDNEAGSAFDQALLTKYIVGLYERGEWS